MIGKMRLQDIVPDKTSATQQELNIIKSIFNGSVVEPEIPKEVQKEIVVEKPKETDAFKFTLLFGVIVAFILLLNESLYKVLYKFNLSNMFIVTLIQLLLGMIVFYSSIKLLKF